MGDAIAHIMISFGFQEQDFVTFSIETRKEQGEDYSTLKGFFKQYELIFIVGDERDLIRVRTDYRKPPEDVYLYRARMTPENARKFFMEYIRQINSMKENPEWYNTLTTNCTTDVVRLIRASGGQARYNWKVLLSGYAPQYAYENGSLDTRIPFEDLRKLSYINPKAAARRRRSGVFTQDPRGPAAARSLRLMKGDYMRVRGIIEKCSRALVLVLVLMLAVPAGDVRAAGGPTCFQTGGAGTDSGADRPLSRFAAGTDLHGLDLSPRSGAGGPLGQAEHNPQGRCPDGGA